VPDVASESFLAAGILDTNKSRRAYQHQQGYMTPSSKRRSSERVAGRSEEVKKMKESWHVLNLEEDAALDKGASMLQQELA